MNRVPLRGVTIYRYIGILRYGARGTVYRYTHTRVPVYRNTVRVLTPKIIQTSTTTDCVFTIGPAIEFLQVISVKPVQYMCVFASPVELSIMWLFLEHTSISAL